MSKRLSTIKVSGGDYAKVASRLKEFREENPRSKHESAYTVDDHDNVVFTVWLWRDKTDLLDLMKSGITDGEILRSSADANGTAKNNTSKKDKDFEKLESIALGRALANLGYLASGEIASLEEMQEFEKYQTEKIAAEKEAAIDKLSSAKTIEALKEAFMSLGELMADSDVVAAKDKAKEKLNANN